MIEEFLVSLRLLRRARGLTVISMLTVALGVGAGTSLFSVVKAVLLNPLPYPHAEQLVRIAEVMPAYPENQVSYPDYEDWRRQNHSFMTMAAYDESPINVGGDEAPLRTIA